MPSSTRADNVYRQLRQDILSGKMEPGARLRIDELSARYDVSSGVLREVLPRLVGQGMVVMVPQQGFRVVDISVQDLRHLTEARICIETLVLRQSVTSGDATWEGEVLASHHRLSRTPQFDDDGNITEEWSAAHADFHHTILAGCANQRLRGLAESLREAAEVYRHWSKSPGEAHHRDIAAEHKQICDLVIERDADAASEALKRHIELTTELLLEGRDPEAEGVDQGLGTAAARL